MPRPPTAPDRLLLCSCDASMRVDPKTAGAATGATRVSRCDRLCTADLDTATQALRQDGTTLIACGQMAGFFADLAADIAAPGTLICTDIRDRAGWTADGPTARDATAKQAALLADALLQPPPAPVRDIVSAGTCLIIGRGDVALDAAASLADRLAVTCLLADAPADTAPPADFDLATGRIASATGALGGFAISVDRYAVADPAGRGPVGFGAPRDGAKSTCDIILDLRGGTPLFPAPHKRDGYLRADPGDPGAVARAIRAAGDLQGTFEKPLYIRFDAGLCAHSRASQPGCDRCLNVCPTGAILPAGDSVVIDPDICAGCGACAAVCPSGAASYDDPPVSHLFGRLRSLARAYAAAGGKTPRLLIHDAFGAEMIALSARFGRGLPVDVIPLEVPEIEGIGHAETLAALGCGFAQVTLLAGPRSDLAVPQSELATAQAILTGTGQAAARLTLISPADPDALEAALYDSRPEPLDIDPILPLGSRREVTRLAATALATGETPQFALPDGAPYGAIVIDKAACTLCLACVSLCPSGALADNPDKPQVRFQETACLQCGICASTCPEDAITLVPQLNLDKAALSHRILHEEEPYHCIECGKPFGVKSTVERIVALLEGKNWMYATSDKTRLIRMCDTCRITSQYHQHGSSLGVGERPRPRTTQDDLDARDGRPPKLN